MEMKERCQQKFAWIEERAGCLVSEFFLRLMSVSIANKEQEHLKTSTEDKKKSNRKENEDNTFTNNRFQTQKRKGWRGKESSLRQGEEAAGTVINGKNGGGSHQGLPTGLIETTQIWVRHSTKWGQAVQRAGRKKALWRGKSV